MSINLDWSELRAKLARDVDRFLGTEHVSPQSIRLYALVDAAQVPELRSAQFQAQRLPHVSLFSLTREHAIAKYGPLLIPLHHSATSAAPLVARLLQAMRYGWTVSWLSSALSPVDLARHLAGHLNGTLADGSNVLVRYYDPRLLSAFLSHLDRPSRSALLAPIDQWAWWERGLDFVTMEGGKETVSPGVSDTLISAATQDALAAAATADLIKSMVVGESDPAEFEHWLPHALFKAVTQQISRARQFGLTAVSDLTLFVSLALRVHPQFCELLKGFVDEQQRIVACEADLPALVLAVSEDDWEQLGSSGANALEELRVSINSELLSTS